MAAALSVVPAAPRSVLDICRVEVSGADHARPPDSTGGEYQYRIDAERPAGSTAKPLKSAVFNVSHDGDFVWPELIFPEDGDWTLNLVDTDDDSVVATLDLTVS
jgi:hypothetical protein